MCKIRVFRTIYEQSEKTNELFKTEELKPEKENLIERVKDGSNRK